MRNEFVFEHCEFKNVEPKVLNDPNSPNHYYIKQVKRQKQYNAIKATNEYLKKNNIKAIPMDKSLGFVLISHVNYQKRLEEITKLSQFKREYRKRKMKRILSLSVNGLKRWRGVKSIQSLDEVPIYINAFIKLCKLARSNILIKGSNGFIRQVTGLGM